MVRSPSLQPRLFRRWLAFVGRVSERVRVVLVYLLLGLVYVLVLPPFALSRRLSKRRVGWIVRDDPGVGSLERLRRRF